MNNTITFVPKSGAVAARNCEEFIRLCRNQLQVFGADLPFDADVWRLGRALAYRGDRSNSSLFFCTLATRDRWAKKKPLHEAFAPFAKAYMRYMHAMEPVTAAGAMSRMKALQAIEQALLETGRPDPVSVTAAILDRAAALIQKQFPNVGVAHQVGCALGRLSRFLDENGLTQVPCNWTNFLPPADRERTKIGAEFEERRRNKLPNQEQLDALAVAYLRATEPLDVIVTSVMAVLLCQPSRISEPLSLPVNCIVPRNDGKPGVMLRWWPAKGAPPMLKPVPATMADIAVEAIGKIVRLTDAARTVAAWYERYPEQLYLPPELEYLRAKELLSVREVGQILWGEAFSLQLNGTPAAEENMFKRTMVWLDARNVRKRQYYSPDRAAPGSARLDVPRVPFALLEAAVMKLLPTGFPIFDRETGLRYSEALCVIHDGAMASNKRPLVCMVEPLIAEHVARRVGGSRSEVSVFKRIGVLSQDGEPVRMQSKQLRHFLNTVAQAGNMQAFEIAAWSGRKDIRQNTVYDHVSAQERVQDLRDGMGDVTKDYAPPARTASYAPILRSEYFTQKIRAGHTTDLGHCVHDFIMAPCQKFGDHMNCEKHVVIKGDQAMEARIRQGYAEARHLFDEAVVAYNDGNAAAKNWLEMQHRRLEMFQQLIAILDDRNVESGAVISLRIAESPSRMIDAMQTRKALDAGTQAAPSLSTRAGPMDMEEASVARGNRSRRRAAAQKGKKR